MKYQTRTQQWAKGVHSRKQIVFNKTAYLTESIVED